MNPLKGDSQLAMEIKETSANETKAKLVVGEREVHLPVVIGSEQEQAVDISQLRNQTGWITLDPGFANTGACLSGITFLDGERGILRYRGIPIEQLAESSTYLETAYLLLYGDLPSRTELERFESAILSKMALPKGMERLVDELPHGVHPMAALSSMVQLLSAFHPELTLPYLTEDRMEEVIAALLAQVPILAAYGCRRIEGKELVPPKKDFTYTENLLTMLVGLPKQEETPSPVAVKAMEQVLILHADHEQNCSTSTVRLVGSSRASAFAAISAGIGALWGPLHGGANQAVIEMLEEIHRMGDDLGKYLAMVKDKRSNVRLMGFGHRVYKNFDPRARILKRACERVLAQIGVYDPLLDLAKRLEEAALKDEYFISRKLYPNVDFYSGILLRALGIPTRQFTIVFALGRLAGWLAHWREMLLSPQFKIGRPRQIYIGPTERTYIPIEQRNGCGPK
jgi:citrate synthase